MLPMPVAIAHRHPAGNVPRHIAYDEHHPAKMTGRCKKLVTQNGATVLVIPGKIPPVPNPTCHQLHSTHWCIQGSQALQPRSRSYVRCDNKERFSSPSLLVAAKHSQK